MSRYCTAYLINVVPTLALWVPDAAGSYRYVPVGKCGPDRDYRNHEVLLSEIESAVSS